MSINYVNILIVSADLPFIGGCGTNSYYLINKLSTIKRYNVIGLFITNIEGNLNPLNYNNKLYKVDINNKIIDNIQSIKKEINNEIGEIDIIIIKNYKSFVFINKVFKNEKKIFISSGLRYFTYEVESKNKTSSQLISEKYNSFEYTFDSSILDNNDNFYDNVIKNDLFLEKYVYENSDKILSNSELTTIILKHSNIQNITTINTSYINYFNQDTINFNDRKYDIIFIAYNLSRKLKNYDLIYNIFSKDIFNNKKIIIIGIDDQIKKINKENIIYKGYLNNNDIIEILKNTKTLICSSYYDSNPNTISEGISCGCNIITSYNVGNSYIIDDELIVKNFFDIDEWINCLNKSLSKKYEIKCKIIPDKILSKFVSIIDEVIYNNTYNLIYNCSNKVNIYFDKFLNSNYDDDIYQNFKCIYNDENHRDYCIDCDSCRYINLLKIKDNFKLIKLEKELTPIYQDMNIKLNNNLYFDIILNIVKRKNMNTINYILFDGACGEPESYNESRYTSLTFDNIKINIIIINKETDIIRFRNIKNTFIRGFYDYSINLLYKKKLLFYSASCLELSASTCIFKYPNYNKILYHSDREKQYYLSNDFELKNLIQFNKYNEVIQNNIKNDREYDILFIGNGTSIVKNFELFCNFIDYTIIKKYNFKIFIISNNKLFDKYKNNENIIINNNNEHNSIKNLDEIYNNSKINIIFSIWDYLPRILIESISYGCYNILFKEIYCGSYIIENNPSIGYVIELDNYDIKNFNLLNIETIFFDKFIPIWDKIIEKVNINFNHRKISKDFNNTYKKDNELNKIYNKL